MNFIHEERKEHWKREIFLFLTSQTISLLGSSLVQYAIMWYITLDTRSGVMMTIYILCGFAPRFSSLAGCRGVGRPFQPQNADHPVGCNDCHGHVGPRHSFSCGIRCDMAAFCHLGCPRNWDRIPNSHHWRGFAANGSEGSTDESEWNQRKPSIIDYVCYPHGEIRHSSPWPPSKRFSLWMFSRPPLLFSS